MIAASLRNDGVIADFHHPGAVAIKDTLPTSVAAFRASQFQAFGKVSTASGAARAWRPVRSELTVHCRGCQFG
jgi:hypothetical protein